MLAIGSRAPEFTLPDQDDRTVSLSTMLNRGPLILYFYPADFTPGCTREACMLRDMHTENSGRGLPWRASVHNRPKGTRNSAKNTTPLHAAVRRGEVCNQDVRLTDRWAWA